MREIIKSVAFNDIQPGDYACLARVIDEETVSVFAELSGDKNPVHLDEDFAAASRFKRRIAHGLISASYFSALFGTKLPGVGCVYVSQNLNFKRPVYLDDEVLATVTVEKIDSIARKVFFKTVCKVNNKTVIDGEAVLYVP